jgi:hypothetical protein
MPMSDFMQDALRTLMFRTGAGLTKPAELFVALHTADPTDAGTGTEVSTTNTNYARVQNDPLDANWSAGTATNGQTANVSDLTYGTPTPSGSGGVSWGTVTHVALRSAVTAGDMYLYGPLTTAKIISPGDPAPKFAAGALSITFV